jgi:hypothetical protein
MLLSIYASMDCFKGYHFNFAPTSLISPCQIIVLGLIYPRLFRERRSVRAAEGARLESVYA